MIQNATIMMRSRLDRFHKKKNFRIGLFGWMGIFLLSCSFSPPGMVWIPPGPFTMGSDEKDAQGRSVDLGLTKPWFQDEALAHAVRLPGYYIDRYETTNREFAAFVRERRAEPPASWKDGRYPPGQDRYPVADVTWYQAEAFCAWAGKRLPTEAEWEKAARGPQGWIYPWGNQFDSRKANLLSDGLRPVGSYPQGASPYHVEDLVGSVWEWTADWYQAYPGNAIASENYGQQFKVIRGKSWTRGFGHHPADEAVEIAAHEARASYRLYYDPVFSFGDLGFRCAKSG